MAQRKDKVPGSRAPRKPRKKPAPLIPALAELFGVEPEAIGSFVIGVEHATEEGVTLATRWTGSLSPWALRGIVHEMKRQAEAQ